ncbi:MAG: hypothetical protein ACHQDD_08785 [Steroidobacterales bacterium]
MKSRQDERLEITALRARLDELNRQVHCGFDSSWETRFDSGQQMEALAAARKEHLTLIVARRDLEVRLAQILEHQLLEATRAVKPISRMRQGTPPRIVRPPGARLGDVLSFLLTRRAYEKIVAPVVADAQYEYMEAVAAGHELHARWIAVRLYIIIWPGWVYGLFASALRRIVGAGTGG